MLMKGTLNYSDTRGTKYLTKLHKYILAYVLFIIWILCYMLLKLYKHQKK